MHRRFLNTAPRRLRHPEVVWTPALIERFWAKVDRRSDSECWNWIGAIGGGGKKNQYGRFKVSDYDTASAHRLAWELANGEALGDRFACHTCDNTKCVNPAHIYAGDHETNTRDAKERGLYVWRGNKRLGSTNQSADRISPLSA